MPTMTQIYTDSYLLSFFLSLSLFLSSALTTFSVPSPSLCARYFSSVTTALSLSPCLLLIFIIKETYAAAVETNIYLSPSLSLSTLFLILFFLAVLAHLSDSQPKNSLGSAVSEVIVVQARGSQSRLSSHEC